MKHSSVSSANFPITSWSREKWYQALPIFLYCKQWKAGQESWEQGYIMCMYTYTLCIYNVPTHVHTVHIQCTHTDTIMHIYRPTSTSQTHTHTLTHTRLTPSLPAAALRTIGVSSPHSVRNDLTHTQRPSQTDSFSLSSKTPTQMRSGIRYADQCYAPLPSLLGSWLHRELTEDSAPIVGNLITYLRLPYPILFERI